MVLTPAARRVRAEALALVLFALAAAPGAARAQERCASPATAAGDRPSRMPGLRYRFAAGDFREDPDGGRWIRFLTEPTVTAAPRVTSAPEDAAAAGALRVGDVIESIDGALITTEHGSRRFASLNRAGTETATISVRRGGRSATVVLPACPLASAEAGGEAPPPAPTPSREAARPAPGERATAPASASAASGMRLRCVACGYRDEDGWRFPTPPVVTEVRAGGPAALAGLLPGDVLVAIDGAPLGTRAGDARFSRLGPGDRARWTVRRGDRLLEVAWTLGG